jgi:HD superfamily phosphohydrolase
LGPFDERLISDPIYGTITLSKRELEVVNTPAFQRLRNIKQLGLAHYVYPGADYSRFSHSLGVCHILGRILGSLHDHGVDIPVEEIELYRLAALLHDVGHYPFSHAMEQALDNYHAAVLLGGKEMAAPLNHEEVGEQIILLDPEVKTLVEGPSVAAILTGKEPPRFTNTVSSDLDADRIDFLLRTAHHTGLPYGAVDLDYIISQMRLDPNGHICLRHKAVRAADHFLLCRFFDRQQVAFHKTVAGFELVLKDVLNELMGRDDIVSDADEVKDMIASGGDWLAYDDASVIAEMRDLYDEVKASGSPMSLKLSSILERHPPKLICELEYMADRGAEQAEKFAHEHKQLLKAIPAAAEKAGIDPSLLYPWRTRLGITKVPPMMPTARAASGDVEEEFHQTIRILNPKGTESKPIFDLRESLMKTLADKAWFSLRLFALLPPDKADAKAVIEAHIRDEVLLPWK